MAIITDTVSGLEVRLRDDYTASGTLNALNAEVVLSCRGSNQVMVGLIGAAGPNLIVAFEGTIDGTNYVNIPGVRFDTSALQLLHTVNVTTLVVYCVPCAGWNLVRVRVSTYTAGSVAVTMRGTIAAELGINLQRPVFPATLHVTNTAAVNTACTTTLPAPGVGLRQYIIKIKIDRLYSVVGVAAAAANNVTTSNLVGSPIFPFGQAASPQGTLESQIIDFAAPIPASGTNGTVTLVCPAQLQTIWRASAWYYVAP